jgi:sugar-specific transcriptional regulator TrmB
MKIEKILESLGLNQKEAQIYLTCLRIGEETAFKIAQASGLKRSTAYFVLDRLKEKGFVSIKKTPKATFFSVISPKRLLLKIERQKEAVGKLLPDLERIYREQPHKPKIQIFEGKKGVELVYREAGEHIKNFEETLYFGSTKHFLSSEYSDLLDLYIDGMKDKRYKAREILVKKELKDIIGDEDLSRYIL